MIRPEDKCSAWVSEADSASLPARATNPLLKKAQPADDGERWSIADLAVEFGVSTRTIRFYEAKGLLAPERIGASRVFHRRDRKRLELILRGKRLGFSLRDIADYLDLYEFDPRRMVDAAHLGRRVGARIALLERQSADLETTLTELKEIRKLTESAPKRGGAATGDGQS